MKKTILSAAILLITVSMLACNVYINTRPVTGISLDAGSLSLEPDESYLLTYTIRPADAVSTGVSWKSGDEDIVSVDQAGKVTAVAIGSAVVTVTTDDGGYTDTCMVTVTYPAVVGLTLDSDSAILSVGESVTLTAEISPSDAEDQEIIWASSDPEIATVEDGVVRGIAEGAASITATSEDGAFSATCNVGVGKTFVTSWNTENAAVSETDQITLPLSDTGIHSFMVAWGDGTSSIIDSYDDSDITHTYPSAGIYEVSMTGLMGGWTFNNAGDGPKLIGISAWGMFSLAGSS